MDADFATLRKQMIQTQLISRGIKDPRVLSAFSKVPREKFISAEHLDTAYGDFPLPIGCGQTISQPYIVALMTEKLKLSEGEHVLEVGTGSGYQTAILAELVEFVYSIERIPGLSEQARQTLKKLGYQNIELEIADGTSGWKRHAPYDDILVTAAAPQVPPVLLSQLKEGGKLIIPLGGSFNQVLTVITKTKDKLTSDKICDCVFVPLVGEYASKAKNA